MPERRSISDFKIGDKVTVERNIEINDIDEFIAVSGDTSSIHSDSAAAIAFGFSGRVAHGMLIGSWISSVIGTKIPGNCGVLQSIKLDFREPIIPPDMLNICLEVTGISIAANQLKLSISVLRSDGSLAVSGEARSIIKNAPSIAQR